MTVSLYHINANIGATENNAKAIRGIVFLYCLIHVFVSIELNDYFPVFVFLFYYYNYMYYFVPWKLLHSFSQGKLKDFYFVFSQG